MPNKKNQSIAILDDIFPNLLTAFRVAEYNGYLEYFQNLDIYSTTLDFESLHGAYKEQYPRYADRVRPYHQPLLEKYAFAYMNFLNNAAYFLSALGSHQIPFIFTLYPGGGFGLENPESDAKLDRILSSRWLQAIIATQSVTVDYLKSRKCPVPVHNIYGGVMQPIYFEETIYSKRPPMNSGIINICFAAYRYMPQGENKGYPQFIAAANMLAQRFPNIRFSVVGNFEPENIPLSNHLRDVLRFHGLLMTRELKEFFLTQHIIISPNRPFVLHPGNFDGFPTGCCAEASLCGVAIICSDELGLNHYYDNWEDMIICDPTPDAIFHAVARLIDEPDLLQKIALRGQMKMRELTSPEVQINGRNKILHHYAALAGLDI